MTDKEVSNSLVSYLEEKKKIRDNIRLLNDQAKDIRQSIDKDNISDAMDKLKAVVESISMKEHEYLVLTRKEISLKNNISKRGEALW